MRLYADASVIAALVFSEPSAPMILDASARADVIWYTDFGIGEACSAISIAIRTRRITRDIGERLAATLPAGLAGWTGIAIDSADVTEASVLVRRFDLGLRMPDALHVAIAKRHSATLLSNDQRQVEAARALGIDTLPPLS